MRRGGGLVRGGVRVWIEGRGQGGLEKGGVKKVQCSGGGGATKNFVVMCSGGWGYKLACPRLI